MTAKHDYLKIMIILRCGSDASTIRLYDGQTNIVNSESCARTHRIRIMRSRKPPGSFRPCRCFTVVIVVFKNNIMTCCVITVVVRSIVDNKKIIIIVDTALGLLGGSWDY